MITYGSPSYRLQHLCKPDLPWDVEIFMLDSPPSQEDRQGSADLVAPPPPLSLPPTALPELSRSLPASTPELPESVVAEPASSVAASAEPAPRESAGLTHKQSRHLRGNNPVKLELDQVSCLKHALHCSCDEPGTPVVCWLQGSQQNQGGHMTSQCHQVINPPVSRTCWST